LIIDIVAWSVTLQKLLRRETILAGVVVRIARHEYDAHRLAGLQLIGNLWWNGYRVVGIQVALKLPDGHGEVSSIDQSICRVSAKYPYSKSGVNVAQFGPHSGPYPPRTWVTV